MDIELTRARIRAGWRVVIPAPLRESLGAEIGQELLFQVTPRGLLLSSLDQAVADAQRVVARYVPPGADLQADLRALRRHDPAVA